MSAEKVIEESKAMSKTEDIALVCYKKPEDFCHRHLVANWFNKMDMIVKNFLK